MIFKLTDFPNGFDAEQLRQALVKAHGAHFNLSTCSTEITLDNTLMPDESLQVVVMQTCLDHFAIDWRKRKLIDFQINAIEQASPITARAMREFMLMVLAYAGTDANSNPAFKRAAAMDAEIQKLRDERPK